MPRMWLLDVNMPKRIAAVLGELGVKAQTAESLFTIPHLRGPEFRFGRDKLLA